MAGSDGPDGTGKAKPDRASSTPVSDDDLDRRRRQLDAALAARQPKQGSGSEGAKTDSASGYAAALRLSSEFIAGILVGAAIGWVIDRVAGTSPWGLIVFLLLGFCAGILNVLRSAGMVAERKMEPPGKDE
jgi:ATP synthase protein I